MELRGLEARTSHRSVIQYCDTTSAGRLGAAWDSRRWGAAGVKGRALQAGGAGQESEGVSCTVGLGIKPSSVGAAGL